MEESFTRLAANLYTNPESSYFKHDGLMLYYVFDSNNHMKVTGFSRNTKIQLEHKNQKVFLSHNNTDLRFNMDLKTKNLDYKRFDVIGVLRKKKFSNSLKEFSKKTLIVDVSRKTIEIKTNKMYTKSKLVQWQFEDLANVIRDPEGLVLDRNKIYMKYDFEFNLYMKLPKSKDVSVLKF